MDDSLENCNSSELLTIQLIEDSPPEPTQQKPKKPKPSKTRQRFTPEEDLILTQLVEKHGCNWNLIAKQLKGRNKRQVKDRWKTFLSPSLVIAPFTPEEDQLLEELINEMGTKWVTFLKSFPNRTDVALKNRWNMIKRQRRNGGRFQKRKKMTPQSSGPAPIYSLQQKSELTQPKRIAVDSNTEEKEFSLFIEEMKTVHECI
jgi:hypothetical protein